MSDGVVMKALKWLSCERELFALNKQSLAMSEVVLSKDGPERIDEAEMCRASVRQSYDNLCRRISKRALLCVSPLVAWQFAAAATSNTREAVGQGLMNTVTALALGGIVAAAPRLRAAFFGSAVANAYRGAIGYEYLNNPAVFDQSRYAEAERQKRTPPAILRARFEPVVRARWTVERNYTLAKTRTEDYFGVRTPGSRE